MDNILSILDPVDRPVDDPSLVIVVDLAIALLRYVVVVVIEQWSCEVRYYQAEYFDNQVKAIFYYLSIYTCAIIIHLYIFAGRST